MSEHKPSFGEVVMRQVDVANDLIIFSGLLKPIDSLRRFVGSLTNNQVGDKEAGIDRPIVNVETVQMSQSTDKPDTVKTIRFTQPNNPSYADIPQSLIEQLGGEGLDENLEIAQTIARAKLSFSKDHGMEFIRSGIDAHIRVQRLLKSLKNLESLHP